MENNEQVLELLRQIEQTGRRQLWMERLRCVFSLLGALCCVAVVIAVLPVLPQLEEMISQMQTTLNNLESVTTQLAEIDLEGMVNNVDNLVAAGQNALNETTRKLGEVDIETLNQAIRDLAAVVEPLARFFR